MFVSAIPRASLALALAQGEFQSRCLSPHLLASLVTSLTRLICRLNYSRTPHSHTLLYLWVLGRRCTRCLDTSHRMSLFAISAAVHVGDTRRLSYARVRAWIACLMLASCLPHACYFIQEEKLQAFLPRPHQPHRHAHHLAPLAWPLSLFHGRMHQARARVSK